MRFPKFALRSLILSLVSILWSCGTDMDLLPKSRLPDLPPPPETQDPHAEEISKENRIPPKSKDLLPERPKLDEEKPLPLPDEPAPVISRQFYWDWDCEKNIFTAKYASSSDSNELPQEASIDLSSEEQAKLSIYGHICPLNKDPVDVIFVIDVSSAMNRVDPRRSATCERLKSLQTMVRSFSDRPDARFALVTYGRTLRFSSTQFLTASQFLNSNAATWRAVCYGSDAAYLDLGLNAAYNLIKKGRTSATKEVYLLTTGTPAAGKDGLAISEKIKSPDDGRAFLAALQVGTGADLSKHVSAATERRSFFQRIPSAQHLNAQAKTIVIPQFASGYVTLKDPSLLHWESFPLQELQNNEVFQINYNDISRQTFPTGITLFFEYSNDRGRKFQYYNSIFWP